MKTLIKTLAVLAILAPLAPAAFAEGNDTSDQIRAVQAFDHANLNGPVSFERADILRGQFASVPGAAFDTPAISSYPSREELMIILGDRGRYDH
jgi:hypothetical protein